MSGSYQKVSLVDDDSGQAYNSKGSVASPSRNQDTGSSDFATSQATANTASANQLVAARPGRIAVTIMNLTGTQKVWLGKTGVTAASGSLLPAAAGSAVTIPTQAAIFGLSETAAQTVSILETF